MTIEASSAVALPPRYRLTSILKETSAIGVYRVVDSVERRDATVKILREPFSEPRDLSQFKSEFAALAALDHPGIIRVFDFGVLGAGYPYFTMEYLPGRKITEAFDGSNWPALYDLVIQIASALNQIHGAGIVHLDLKPSNILVRDDGVVKIMDFGVAAEVSEIIDRKVRGTLHYMAPEVIRQDKIDFRADLYGLGMTLYETVTGALPTWGRPPIDVIRFHLDEEIRRPSSINPSIPEPFERVIMRLLEKDPRHRYASAFALLQDVALIAGKRVDPGRFVVSSRELLATPLVGRRAEAASLGDSIVRARSGEGGGTILIGAEGTGKSRLVREVALRAQLEGASVFTGRCPFHRKTTYAPFLDIFHQMVSEINPEADAAAEIRGMLEPFVGPRAGESRPIRGQKLRLYNRIAQAIQDFYGYLSAIGVEAAPLVLVVEDLQWADAASAELFTFLVGEARHSSLFVIGTLTGDSAPEEAGEETVASLPWWTHRAREFEIPIMRLGSLGEADVRELVSSLLGQEEPPTEFVRWILWESGGAPRQVRSVIEYLIEHDYLVRTLDGWVADMPRIQSLRIPGGTAALWSETLGTLDQEQRTVLQLLAVLGDEAPVALLSNVAGMSAESLYTVLEQLAKRGLVEESGDGRTFAFPETSLRETIYVSASEAERAAAHLRAGLTLEQSLEEGATELIGQAAHHFARCSEHQKGIEYSIRAGDLAATALSHEQAAEFYRQALELMDLAGADERKAEIRERLADAYYRSHNFRAALQVYQFLLKSLRTRTPRPGPDLGVAGIMKKIAKVLARRAEYDSALGYFEDALEICRAAGESVESAELLTRMAWVHRSRGDLVEAARAATLAEASLDDSEPGLAHGHVHNTLGVILFEQGQIEPARKLFADALSIANRIGSDSLRKLVRANIGKLRWRTGDWDGALLMFRENLEQSEAEGDLWDLVSSYDSVGTVELARGNFKIAADLFGRSVRLDEKLGVPQNEAVAQENLGQALEMTGRWTEAREHYDRCLRLEGFDEHRPSRVSVYIPLARLTSKTGDIAAAIEFTHKAHDAAAASRDHQLAGEASLLLARIERDRENHEDAVRAATEARTNFESTGWQHGVARAHLVLGDLAFVQGAFDDAMDHAEKAATIAASLRDRFTAAQADWIVAKVLSSAGNRENAEARFESALVAFDDLDTPYERGRLVFEIGLLREDPEEAAQLIRRAIRIFEDLGATHDLDRARGALFRVRPSGRLPESGVVGLYEVVKVINSTLDLEEVLNRVLDIALRRLRAERGMLILLDPITSEARTRVVRNIREGAEADSKRSPQSIIKEVITSGHSVISADARADDRFVDSDSVIAENIVSTLCVPLVIREQIAGAIYVDHRQTRHLFSQRDLNFLEAFADQAAIAIENARLYQELEQAKTRLSLENESLRKEVLVEKHLDSVVGHSEAVAKIQFTVRKASAANSTVLVRGESGTGKGLVARIIHNVGPRRNGPFIKFNCAALPETLAESELFGHEKGSFTGADRRKLGRFELANGGTIFLDEIGKTTLSLQAKLLRVVEDKEFERVGGTQTIKVEVKIIAAANDHLEKMIEDGRFREDLFYRLNIIPLYLPPLRERKDDIPALAEHFIRKICRDLGVEPVRLEPGILDLFATYAWPGNIRELEATLHRAIVMSTGNTLTRADFYGLLGEVEQPFESASPAMLPNELLNPIVKRMTMSGDVYDDVSSRVDRQLIRQALQESGGKIRETARRLGLARNTLKAKLLKYGMSVEE